MAMWVLRGEPRSSGSAVSKPSLQLLKSYSYNYRYKYSFSIQQMKTTNNNNNKKTNQKNKLETIQISMDCEELSPMRYTYNTEVERVERFAIPGRQLCECLS